MLNLRRGFRRLFLVVSVVWIVASGVYLWRLPPPPWVDYEALAAQYGGVPAGAPGGTETLTVEAWERRYKVPLRELDEALRSLTPERRTAALNAFAGSSNEDDLAERLKTLTLPTEVKAKLWDLKALTTPSKVETLAQIVRRNYPGEYDDLTDQQLEQKVRTKYPGIDLGMALTSLPPGFVLDRPNRLPPGYRVVPPASAGKAEKNYLSTDPIAGIPIGKTTPGRNPAEHFDLAAALARQKAVVEKEKRDRLSSWLEAWLQIGFMPPVIGFALLESLLWAARGFSDKQTTSKSQDKEQTASGESPRS